MRHVGTLPRDRTHRPGGVAETRYAALLMARLDSDRQPPEGRESAPRTTRDADRLSLQSTADDDVGELDVRPMNDNGP